MTLDLVCFDTTVAQAVEPTLKLGVHKMSDTRFRLEMFVLDADTFVEMITWKCEDTLGQWAADTMDDEA